MSVRVSLVTQDEDIKVDETPLYVPVDLKRYGLSEVVNQLLKTTEPIPFDFLVDGELLRSSVSDYLKSKGLSSESVLTLEYVRAIMPPRFVSSFAHDDWVSAVQFRKELVATGSYDGIVRIWDRSGQVKDQYAGHNGSIKDVKWISDRQLVSAGSDRQLCLWTDKKLSCIFSGHKAAVNSVCTLQNRIVSGSADNSLKVWSANYKDLPPPPKPAPSKFSQTQKRRKLAENALADKRVRGALSTLEGHVAPVTAVVPHPTADSVVYSCSEDHTLRTWDLVTGQLVDTKTTSSSLLSLLALGPPTNLLACGSVNRHISLIDPRATTTTSQSQLTGHKNFVVALAQSPKNSHQFASASHDGTVRVWDVRANKSVFILERPNVAAENRDLYCVDWDDVIATGGRAKTLEIAEMRS